MMTISELILAKVEATKGVNSTPTEAADAVLASGLSWKLEDLGMIDQAAEMGSGTGADRQSIFANYLKTVTFDVKLKGSGVAGTPPEVAALLRMCAMAENIVPATSVTYLPVTDFDTQETGTLVFQHEGLRHTLTGAVGTYTANFETNNAVMLSFTITGHSTKPVDNAFTPGTYNNTVPPVVSGAGFSAGGYAAVISSLAFDYGANVAKPKDMNQADGFGTLGLSKFSPKGSFDPLMVTVAVNDFMGDLEAGTNMAMDTGPIGADAGNRIRLLMPGIYYMDASPGDREGFRTYEIPIGATDVTGDDFASFIFT